MRKIVQGYMWKELLADLVRWLRSTPQVLCSTQEQKNIELLSESCKQKHYNKSAFAMLILQEKAEKRVNQSSCLLILVGTVLYLQSTRAQYKLLLCSNTVPHRAEVNFFQNSNYGTFVIHPCWEELFLLLLICLYLLSTLCLDKANFIYSKHILCVWNKANFPSYMTHDNKECYEKKYPSNLWICRTFGSCMCSNLYTICMKRMVASWCYLHLWDFDIHIYHNFENRTVNDVNRSNRTHSGVRNQTRIEFDVWTVSHESGFH